MNTLYLVEAGDWWELYDQIGIFDDGLLAVDKVEEWTSYGQDRSAPNRWGTITVIEVNTEIKRRQCTVYRYSNGKEITQ